MFLFLNAITASLDGLIIGIGLRLANIKIKKQNTLIILIGNLFIYAFFLFLYYYLNLSFMTKGVTTILYILLAWHAFHEQDSLSFKEKFLSLTDCLVITCTHSLDGTLVSLNFVYQYSIWHIVSVFSIMSLLILLIGYYFAKLFKSSEKQNYVSAFLFLLLAIINQFL